VEFKLSGILSHIGLREWLIDDISNLQNTLLLVDVRVLDHLIIGHREIVSFAERGWL